MLALVCRHFKKSVVLLNVGNIIDMQWVMRYNPGAVAYIWQGGQEGCRGVLDVLNEPRLNHQVAVEEGVLQPQCSEIMKRFFKRFRKNANAAPLTENQ